VKRDTVLHRDVALQVLPESLAGAPDRLMRPAWQLDLTMQGD